MRHRRQVVDCDLRSARRLGVAPQAQKRIEIVQEMSCGGRSESDQMVLIEILDLTRLRAPPQIVGRGVGVEMHGEQAAPNQVRLAWLA